ncbi:hypothetical protein [Paracraurococcus lichenis]|uniref:Uncharacterized protein n=1 Tax=Paracraurococcus lichenis TaxID=3064888 RepID=A0ABT9EEF9_9PROT|nr:hypothetical protein [Paracraurococcus sp. LOR1-02]MDO9714610.1 hypothetical protein [Paracraurococcus sp. LOR1-02]
MLTATESLEALSTALVGQHATRYSGASATAYFELGTLLAHTGAEVPDWLMTTPRWARAAVAIGRSATRHRLRESRSSQ